MSIEDIILQLREDRQIAERECLQARIAAAFELARKDAPGANVLNTRIDQDSLVDVDEAAAPLTAAIKPQRSLMEKAAPLLQEIRATGMSHRRNYGVCWDIGDEPRVNDVNQLFETALAALGYESEKPSIRRGSR